MRLAISAVVRRSRIGSNADDPDTQMMQVAEQLVITKDEENEIIDEVCKLRRFFAILRIRLAISEAVLYDSVRRLPLLDIILGILQEQIRMKKDQCKSATASSGKSQPTKCTPSLIEEDKGLPSPPLDDFDNLLASQELSKFFDGLEEENASTETVKIGRSPRSSSHQDTNAFIKKDAQELRRSGSHSTKLRGGKFSNRVTRSERPQPQKMKQKVEGVPTNNNQHLQKAMANEEANPDHKQSAKGQVKYNLLDEAAMEAKLEATRKKLKEDYEQVDRAKKRRTIRVLDPRELPKLPYEKNRG